MGYRSSRQYSNSQLLLIKIVAKDLRPLLWGPVSLSVHRSLAGLIRDSFRRNFDQWAEPSLAGVGPETLLSVRVVCSLRSRESGPRGGI